MTLRWIAVFLSLVAMSGMASAAPVFPQASGIGLEPPAGMEAAEDFLGFRKDDATILIVELPADAYAKLNADRSRVSARIDGAKIADFALDPKTSAFIVRGTQKRGEDSYRKWIVVLGDSRETAIVTVQVPSEEGGIGDAAVEAALRTITIRDRPGLAQQVASLPFAVGDMAGFRATAAVAGAMLVMTDGPKDDDPEFAQPHMIVSISAGDPPATDKDRLAIAHAVLDRSKVFKGVKVTAEKTFQADESSWAEIDATATAGKADKPVDIALFVRFDEDGFIASIGAAPQGGTAYGERFRKIALSSSLKE